jgi:hypothetical protein
MNQDLALFRLLPSAPARDADRHIAVASKQVLKLRLAAGTCVSTESGRIWLTEPGDPDDHFLASNDCHTVAHGGCIVIECDSPQPARVRIGR